MRRTVLVATLPAAGLFVVALWLRFVQHHDALLYPDGYQYLLMARGIGEHLTPTTILGPGGDSFVPSPDAAAKPLFPVFVALVHTLGVSWLSAAQIVTATAAAATVVLVALLTARLGGSWWAAAGAALLLLASPSLGFWSGFSGPDPLAQALGLAAALAFVYRRPRVGGTLTGLAIAARPELAVIAIAGAIAAARNRTMREDVRHGASYATICAGLVFALLRPPLALPDWQLVSLAPIVLACVALVAVAPALIVRCAAVAGLGAATLVVLTSPGAGELWRDDWPLLVLAVAGFVVLIGDEHRSAIAVLLLGGALLLGSVYLVKNPLLERYFVLLLPFAALLVGIATAALPHRARPVALVAIALAVVVGFGRPIPGSRDHDVFSAIAERIAPSLPVDGALVTAAPDAYGFWLPQHAVRVMRAGVHGAILLDPAQRLYEPGLTAEGKVVVRVVDEIAFSRPNGEIDAYPAVVVAGSVIVAPPHVRRR